MKKQLLRNLCLFAAAIIVATTGSAQVVKKAPKLATNPTVQTQLRAPKAVADITPKALKAPKAPAKVAATADDIAGTYVFTADAYYGSAINTLVTITKVDDTNLTMTNLFGDSSYPDFTATLDPATGVITIPEQAVDYYDKDTPITVSAYQGGDIQAQVQEDGSIAFLTAIWGDFLVIGETTYYWDGIYAGGTFTKPEERSIDEAVGTYYFYAPTVLRNGSDFEGIVVISKVDDTTLSIHGLQYISASDPDLTATFDPSTGAISIPYQALGTDGDYGEYGFGVYAQGGPNKEAAVSGMLGDDGSITLSGMYGIGVSVGFFACWSGGVMTPTNGKMDVAVYDSSAQGFVSASYDVFLWQEYDETTGEPLPTVHIFNFADEGLDVTATLKYGNRASIPNQVIWESSSYGTFTTQGIDPTSGDKTPTINGTGDDTTLSFSYFGIFSEEYSLAQFGAAKIYFTTDEVFIYPETGDVSFKSDWATYFNSTAQALPEDVDAYIITAVDTENAVVALEQQTFLPADTPLLINKNGAETEFAFGDADVSGEEVVGTPVENFMGFDKETELDAQYEDLIEDGVTYQIYILKNNEFVKANAGTLPAGKCILAIPVEEAAAAPVLKIKVGTDDTTGIQTVGAAQSGAATFDLQGRRVMKAQNGIYIVAGKKVLVK